MKRYRGYDGSRRKSRGRWVHDESGKRGKEGGRRWDRDRGPETRDNKCEIGDFSPLVLSLVNSLERAMIPII